MQLNIRKVFLMFYTLSIYYIDKLPLSWGCCILHRSKLPLHPSILGMLYITDVWCANLGLPGYFGLEAVVDWYASPVVQLQAHGIQAQVPGEGPSADTHQQHVTRQSLVLPAGSRLHTGGKNTVTFGLGPTY